MGVYKKNKTRKKRRLGNLLNTGTICIVLIVSFTLLGASYASWSQTFSIFGTVTTGDLDVAVRDIVFESSDGYESCSFTAHKDGNVVDEVVMDVVTESDPFGVVLVFSVQNTGTMPVTCVGIDKSVTDNLDVIMLDAPSSIAPGQTADIRVRIIKGYCNDFEFSAFLEFEQVV